MSPQNKRQSVLVTGGAGFIGSNFVELLVNEGHQVAVLDVLSYAGHRENLNDINGPGSCEFYQGCITDKTLVSDILKRHHITWLVNFAAESHVDRSISGPAPFIKTNIMGVYNLLAAGLEYYRALPAADQSRWRFLHVSTDEVYGELGNTGKFSETSPYRPNSPYSASKASGDMLVRAWHHTYGLPTLTTNCSNNYGPRQFPEKLIPFMLRSALSDKPLGIYGNGMNVRDWIHVQDHCQGILLALKKGEVGQTYCFGGDSELNNVQVVHHLCDILDQLKPRADKRSYREQITFVQDRLGHDFRYAIDDHLAQSKLGFTRQHNFSSGLRKTVEWYLSNETWMQAVLANARRHDQTF